MTCPISSNSDIRVKICGITRIDQAIKIANLSADAIGVIGVKSSPRFVAEEKRREIFNKLNIAFPKLARVWVVADLKGADLIKGIEGNGVPSVIQLHGNESEEYCENMKIKFPNILWWKALRI